MFSFKNEAPLFEETCSVKLFKDDEEIETDFFHSPKFHTTIITLTALSIYLIKNQLSTGYVFLTFQFR
jgi:hypothetical protein